MPHYKDGTPAKVGDIVHGKGYNIPYQITGVVVAVLPSNACNIQVAYAEPRRWENIPEGYAVIPVYPALAIEYGACADFEKVA